MKRFLNNEKDFIEEKLHSGLISLEKIEKSMKKIQKFSNGSIFI